MAHILFSAWKQSLALFYPRTLWELIRNAFTCYWGACKRFGYYFYVFLLADFVMKIIFGELITKTLPNATQVSPATALLVFASFIMGINWFVVSTALLLLIRKRSDDLSSPLVYFKNIFFKYVQLALVVSLVLFVILSLIISLGITRIPNPHWAIKLFLRGLEVLMIFYWLDSQGNFIDMLRSLEGAMNFLLYNLPIIIPAFIGGLVFSMTPLHTLLTVDPKNFSLITFIARSYLSFLCEYFVISLMFVIYDKKRLETYTISYFDKQE